MNANEVKPHRWCWDDSYPIKVLYDDGEYSVIWGKYDGVKFLGTRWNGDEIQEDDKGYPRQGKYPTWYVEPDFIATAILQKLLNEAIENGKKKFIDNIIFAIKELTNKINEK